MRKLIKIISCLLVAICGVSATACSKQPGEYKYVVELADNGALLSNPDMGWNFCYYSNQLAKFGKLLNDGDYLDDFPCDIVYFRIGWNFIQPDKEYYNTVLKPSGYEFDENTLDGDHFHWDVISDVIDKWSAEGKRAAIRIVVNDGWGQSAPLWLKDKMSEAGYNPTDGVSGVAYDPVTEGSAKQLASGWSEEKIFNSFTPEGKVWYTSEYEQGHTGEFGYGRKTWVPDYGNEIFLKYYEKMLTALKDKFEENLEFVEMGSIGTWGEGHDNRSDPTKPFLTDEARLAQCDMYHNVFGNDVLVITNDDIIKGTDVVKSKCIEYGFGCVDDSLQVDVRDSGSGVYTGAAELDDFAMVGLPVGIESAPSTVPMEVYYKAVLYHQASYVRLIVDPSEAKTSEWTDKITKAMGYRLNFVEAKITDPLAGRRFTASLKVKNVGVSQLKREMYAYLKLVGENGEILSEGRFDYDLSQLPVGGNNYYDSDTYDALIAEMETNEIKATLDLPDKIPAGRYYLHLYVADKGGETKLSLPLDGGRNKEYRIMTFDVKG